MSSPAKYVFTPCCPELPTLEFKSNATISSFFGVTLPHVFIYNNTCYTVEEFITGFVEFDGLPDPPLTTELTPAGENCLNAEDSFSECICSKTCYILYECADTFDETPVRFATTTDLSAYVGGSVKIDEYPTKCFIVQERTDAEIDSSLCINAQDVTISAVQDCVCECKCFTVSSKNSIIYTDCDGNIIRGTVPPATGLQICSITYPISENDDLIRIEAKGDCVDGLCPSECYILEDCEGIEDPIYTTSQSVLPYVGSGEIIQIEGYDRCWTVSPSEICDCPVDVTVIRYYDDCISCTGVTAYRLENCDTGQIYTTSDLSAYVGQVVELNECEGCWEVNEIDVQPPTDLTVSVSTSYEDCLECKRDYWLLTDCSDEQNTLITYTDLSAYDGQIVRLDHCPTICWIVSSTRLSTNAQPVILEGSYADCSECFLAANPAICRSIVPTKGGTISYVDTAGELVDLAVTAGVRTPKLCVRVWSTSSFTNEIIYGECVDGECPKVEYKTRSVQPGYDTPACTPQYYEKVVCNFSEAVYKEVLEKRYGISNCCPQDFDKWEIKKEIIHLEALKDPDYECSTSQGVCNTAGYVQPNCEIVEPLCQSYSLEPPRSAATVASVVYRDCDGTITTFETSVGEGGVCYQFCALDSSLVVNLTGLVNDSYTIEPIRECTDADAEECSGGALSISVDDNPPPTYQVSLTYINCAGETVTENLTLANFEIVAVGDNDKYVYRFCGSTEFLENTTFADNSGGVFKVKLSFGSAGSPGEDLAYCSC